MSQSLKRQREVQLVLEAARHRLARLAQKLRPQPTMITVKAAGDALGLSRNQVVSTLLLTSEMAFVRRGRATLVPASELARVRDVLRRRKPLR